MHSCSSSHSAAELTNSPSTTHKCLSYCHLLLQVERIAKVAFESAQKRKGKLCSVEKSNVLEVSQLWKEVVTRVGKDYPDVELSHMYTNTQLQMHYCPFTLLCWHLP